MIPIAWFVGTVIFLITAGLIAARWMLLEIRALTRALIANNTKDLVMLEKAAAPGPRARKVAPEVEGTFAEPTLRPMGLA